MSGSIFRMSGPWWSVCMVEVLCVFNKSEKDQSGISEIIGDEPEMVTESIWLDFCGITGFAVAYKKNHTCVWQSGYKYEIAMRVEEFRELYVMEMEGLKLESKGVLLR